MDLEPHCPDNGGATHDSATAQPRSDTMDDDDKPTPKDHQGTQDKAIEEGQPIRMRRSSWKFGVGSGFVVASMDLTMDEHVRRRAHPEFRHRRVASP